VAPSISEVPEVWAILLPQQEDSGSQSQASVEERVFLFGGTQQRGYRADGPKAEWERDHEGKITWAATELRRLRKHHNDAWYEDSSVKSRLVSAVNRQQRIRRDPRQQIAINFISRYRREIQAKADSGNPESSGRRNHATR
jgi:hypothetical protein